MLSPDATAHVLLDRALAPHLDADELPPAALEDARRALGVSARQVRRRFDEILRDRAALERLRAVPVLEQRSPEWHAARGAMITASDFAQCLGKGKFGTAQQFFEKKVGHDPYEFPDLPPLRWGVMFEPVAAALYARWAGVPMHEFGLIPHHDPDCAFLGASPDGVSDLGVMLEIKCPMIREITGEIPEQYVYQIQGQMEVTDLSCCDYLECKFAEYAGEAEFLRDADEDHCSADGLPKGVFVEVDGRYVYPDRASCGADWTAADAAEWARGRLADGAGGVAHFWFLRKSMVRRVARDRVFFMNILASLRHVWSQVLAYRADEARYRREMRAPRPSAAGRTTRRAATARAAPIPAMAIQVHAGDRIA